MAYKNKLKRIKFFFHFELFFFLIHDFPFMHLILKIKINIFRIIYIIQIYKTMNPNMIVNNLFIILKFF